MLILCLLLLAIMAAEEKRKQKEQIKIMKQQVNLCDCKITSLCFELCWDVLII